MQRRPALQCPLEHQQKRWLPANKTFNKLGVTVEARLLTELYGFASGTVEFEIESENRMPVKVSADVTSTNLTNLASSINQTSSATGVTAYLSNDKARLILDSSEGEDIVLSELSEASTTFSMRIIDKDNLPAITPLELCRRWFIWNIKPRNQTFAINNSSGEGVGATADVTLNNGNLTLAINKKGMDTKSVTHLLFWDQHLVAQTEQTTNNNGWRP